jgi:ureidoglycolate lyase
MNEHKPTEVHALTIEPVSAAAFAPFGTLIEPGEDGVPFGPADAALQLGQGTPRFYTMRLPNRGMQVRQITRHRRVTQVLASAGGHDWVLAVAPPGNADDPVAEPALADIRAFRVPGTLAVMLGRGTWHAGPLFAAPTADFFNLELADTNLVDHQSCDLRARYGVVLDLVAR